MPNITGEIKHNLEKNTSSQFLDDTNIENYSVTGAFGLVEGINYGVQNYSAYTGAVGFNISASRSSALYNATKTVQPNSIRYLFVCRI